MVRMALTRVSFFNRWSSGSGCVATPAVARGYIFLCGVAADGGRWVKNDRSETRPLVQFELCTFQLIRRMV